MTETLVTLFKKLKEVFNKNISNIMSGKEKGKQMHDGKTSAIEKLQNLRSYFVHKIHFTCLERAIDIKINTLPRVLYSCLALHK